MARYALVRILDDNEAESMRGAEVTLNELTDKYLVHALSYKRLTTLSGNDKPTISMLKHFFSDNPFLSAIDEALIDKFVLHIKNKLSPSSLRQRITAAKSIFQFGVNHGLIDKNPFQGIKLPPPSFAGRVLNDREIEVLLNNLSPTIQRVCKLSLYTGLRAREITSLEWSQVYDDHIVIPVNKSKSKRDGIVYLSTKTRELLGPPGNGSVFMIKYHCLRRTLKAAWQSAKIGRVRFHDLRHTWATRFYEINKDFAALMSAGRWRSYSSALIYQHISPGRQKEAAEKVEYEF